MLPTYLGKVKHKKNTKIINVIDKNFITNSDETFKKGDLDVSGQIGGLIRSRILHNTTEHYSWLLEWLSHILYDNHVWGADTKHKHQQMFTFQTKCDKSHFTYVHVL